MYRVKLQYQPMSCAAIRNALIHVQHSVLKHKGTQHRYVIPSKISPEAKKIYQLMNLKASSTPYQLD